LINKLNDYNLAYIHLMEPQADVSQLPNYLTNVAEYFRPLYKGTLMANAGMTKEKANKLIEDGIADLVSFGSLFISNPDLPRRFELDAPLNEPDRKTFYGGGEQGYTDYPFLAV
jgi:N-ethylmaleimide reductase